jgi:hypothetical protein
MSRPLERAAFLAWLESLGEGACGTPYYCPVACFMGLTGPACNMTAAYRAASLPWLQGFTVWADGPGGVHVGAWHEVLASDALLFLLEGRAD